MEYALILRSLAIGAVIGIIYALLFQWWMEIVFRTLRSGNKKIFPFIFLQTIIRISILGILLYSLRLLSATVELILPPVSAAFLLAFWLVIIKKRGRHERP